MTQKMANQMESGFDKKQAKYTESDIDTIMSICPYLVISNSINQCNFLSTTDQLIREKQ